MKRRPFLISTGATGLMTAISRAQTRESRKLNWALVGLGSLSTNQLAPALAKSKISRLAGIVTGTPSKAESWKAKYSIPEGNIYNYENFDQLADNPEIDVIYIVLPNGMHEEFTIRAAKAGKHVFCEKPMANSPEECRRMIAACKEAGRKLGIAYRCQFEPHHLEAMRLAKAQTLGNLRHIRAGFGFRIGSPDQWRLDGKLAGGGALMDVGVYALQACRYLVGEEPAVVSAIETNTSPEKFDEVEETIAWTMRFPSGVSANCETSYGFGGLNDFTAFADNGQFGIRNAFGYGGQDGWTSRDGVEIEFDQIDHFTAEIDAFSQSILDDTAFRCPGEEGLRDMLVVDAIYRSVREGRTVEVGRI